MLVPLNAGDMLAFGGLVTSLTADVTPQEQKAIV